MPLIKLLREDHDLTLIRAWPILNNACERLNSGQELPADTLSHIADFMKGFVIGHHFPPEDEVMALAQARGLTGTGSLLDQIRMEHEEARNYIENMYAELRAVQTGDREAFQSFADTSAELVAFLIRHETEENEILFPQIQDVILEGEEQALLRRFGDDNYRVHQRFILVLNRLGAEVSQPEPFPGNDRYRRR